tara:strand:+ start:24320 stop:24982 length:663 start_codon:yes stop_codon:yes gene_type:complete
MATHLFDSPNEEWLQLRKNYITATEMACLFKMGYKSAGKLMEEKMTLDHRIIKNEYMIIGNILEPAVLNCFKYRMGMDVGPAHPSKIVMLTDDEHRISSTPDGVFYTDSGHQLIECKTTHRKIDEWLDKLPDNYNIQVHVQLLTADLDVCMIGCMQYEYPLPFVAYKVKRNKRIDAILQKEAKRFWDCFDNDKVFEADLELKKELKILLAESCELVYTNR